jgi:hypothetical protein
MAQHPQTRLDASPAALASLNQSLTEYDAEALETEIQAHAFLEKCRSEQEADERMDRAEHLTTEVLEVVVSPAAGALSLWQTKGGLPIGGAANIVLGIGGKALSLLNPQARPLRVAGRVTKVLLHSQLSITTRNMIKGSP